MGQVKHNKARRQMSKALEKAFGIMERRKSLAYVNDDEGMGIRKNVRLFLTKLGKQNISRLCNSYV